MTGILIFLLFPLLVILIIALSIVFKLISGVRNFFGSSSEKDSSERSFSSSSRQSEDDSDDYNRPQTEEGARRMREFKNSAESVDYEEV